MVSVKYCCGGDGGERRGRVSSGVYALRRVSWYSDTGTGTGAGGG